MKELSVHEYLALCQVHIKKIHEQTRKFLTNAPITDEHLENTLEWAWGNDRYILILPDGRRYYDVPGYRGFQTSFVQRPAALRTAQHLPGCRVYDIKEKKVING
jgi:hypothetical protein